MTSHETRARNTLTGFRQRIDNEVVEPPRLTRAEYLRLDEIEQQDYDMARIQWIATRYWVPNLRTRELMSSVRLALAARDPLVVGERGICLYGPSHAGKTTALMKVATAVEKQAARKDADYREHGHVPVVWLDIPPNATPKAIGSSILRFFGVPYNARESQDDVLSRAISLTALAKTDLIIIDEVQMLRLEGRSGDAAVNALKALMNGTPATCLFSGVDLRKRLNSQAAQQILRRCEEIEIAPMRASVDEERADFGELVGQFSKELRLLDQADDYLLPHTDLLLRLSGGLMGPLRHIISGATSRAIMNKGDAHAPEAFGVDAIRRAASGLRLESIEPTAKQRKRAA